MLFWGEDRHYNLQRLHCCVSLCLSLSSFFPYTANPNPTKAFKSVRCKESKESEREQKKQRPTSVNFAMESQTLYEKEEEALVLKTTKVVEYLVPKMSIELLCKFPDNSAYDFDYSQSTIWSPLLPRPYSPMDLDLITPKKLSYDMGLGAKCSVKKVGSKLRKKFTASAFNLNLDFIKKNSKSKNKKLPSDFSPTPFKGACNPILNKRWARALKAASKQFKKWKVKRRDPIAHVMLPRL
ncbi:hypothetical protein JHK82_034948 [Glycine max]|nr:hypothetical protein JHK87_034867 [Glycine soja]KAG5111679.1 hypothetical protein JHK82_034948 [Glycine max]